MTPPTPAIGLALASAARVVGRQRPPSGVGLLLPLYFQIVRGRDALDTGLLLIPQGAQSGTPSRVRTSPAS